jgi:hypothetical protein
MFLDISIKSLQNRSVFEYIAATIETKFPDSKADADAIRNAKTQREVERIFNDYYEGWKYDGVQFSFGDIDNIIYWMDQEVILYKKDMENKKYIAWLERRGLNPAKLNKKSS